MVRLYDDDKIQEILADYKSGMTMKQVAEKYNCSWQSVQNWLSKRGRKIRSKGYRSKYKIASIRNDWNADKDVDKIVMTYGFPSRNALYKFVGRNRDSGFKMRGKMTQSEEITAGCIGQGGAK